MWRQELEASIESLLGSVYPDINQSNISDVRFNPQEQLLFGVDFNRTPLCGAFCNFIPMDSENLSSRNVHRTNKAIYTFLSAVHIG